MRWNLRQAALVLARTSQSRQRRTRAMLLSAPLCWQPWRVLAALAWPLQPWRVLAALAWPLRV